MKQILASALAFVVLALGLSGCSWFKRSAPQPLPVGEAAFYPLNGNALDAMAHGHHGTAWDIQWVADRGGRAQKAARFNGESSFIEFPDTPRLNLTRAVTFSLWVRPASKSGYRRILSKEQACNSAANYALIQWNDKFLFQFWDGVESDKKYLFPMGADTGEWRHLAVAYDYENREIRAWLDGEPVSGQWYQGKPPQGSSPVLTTNPLTLGAGKVFYAAGACAGYRPGDHYGFFSGDLDEVRIYPRILTDGEVRTLSKN